MAFVVRAIRAFVVPGCGDYRPMAHCQTHWRTYCEKVLDGRRGDWTGTGFHLRAYQLSVRPVVLYQYLMRATFDDFSTTENQNEVRAANCGKAVCNDEGRAAAH